LYNKNKTNTIKFNRENFSSILIFLLTFASLLLNHSVDAGHACVQCVEVGKCKQCDCGPLVGNSLCKIICEKITTNNNDPLLLCETNKGNCPQDSEICGDINNMELITPSQEQMVLKLSKGRNSCGFNAVTGNFSCGATEIEEEIAEALLTFLDLTNLEPCCDGHDNCYGTCGKPKTKCDNDFYNCLQKKCQEKFGLFNPKRALCYTASELMYQAVNWAGKSPYDEAQKNCQHKKEIIIIDEVRE
jgi:hypothetical protein